MLRIIRSKRTEKQQKHFSCIIRGIGLVRIQGQYTGPPPPKDTRIKSHGFRYGPMENAHVQGPELCATPLCMMPKVISWHGLQGNSGCHHKFEAHEKLMRQGHQWPLRCVFKELLSRTRRNQKQNRICFVFEKQNLFCFWELKNTGQNCCIIKPSEGMLSVTDAS